MIGSSISCAGQQHDFSPLVSVIIPFYKQEAYLPESIQSVEQQSYPRVEIIVVDDGSPVPAQTVIGEKANVRIFRTPNRERSAARNYGFQQSSGQYLIFLDADDRLAPGAIEAHLEAFKSNPDAGLSFGPARTIDEDGRVLQQSHTCRPRSNYYLKFLESNPIASPGATMLQRDAFVRAGLFDESFRQAEDYLLYLRISRTYPVAQHNVCVLDRRVHGSNTIYDKRGMLKATLAVLDLVESDTVLSSVELRRLRHGRRRWRHEFSRDNTLAYRVRALYFSWRAMRDVPLSAYFTRNA